MIFMGKTPCEFILWNLRQAVKGFVSKKYDWVFVDEAYDLNKVQFDLIKMICNGQNLHYSNSGHITRRTRFGINPLLYPWETLLRS